VEFVGDGLLLGEIGWDDSDDCGGVSGKILSVSAKTRVKEIKGEEKEIAEEVKVFEVEEVLL